MNFLFTARTAVTKDDLQRFYIPILSHIASPSTPIFFHRTSFMVKDISYILFYDILGYIICALALSRGKCALKDESTPRSLGYGNEFGSSEVWKFRSVLLYCFRASAIIFFCSFKVLKVLGVRIFELIFWSFVTLFRSIMGYLYYAGYPLPVYLSNVCQGCRPVSTHHFNFLHHLFLQMPRQVKILCLPHLQYPPTGAINIRTFASPAFLAEPMLAVRYCTAY